MTGTMTVTIRTPDGRSDVYADVTNCRLDMDLGGAIIVEETLEHVVTADEMDQNERARSRMPPIERARATTYMEGQIVKVEAVRAVYSPGAWSSYVITDRS